MPGEAELEAARRATRQKAEEDLYRARRRLEEAEAREQQARADWEKKPAEADYSRAPWEPTPGEYHRDPAVREAMEQASKARDEVSEAEFVVANLPPPEDILSEIKFVPLDSDPGQDEAPRSTETARVGYSTGGLPPKSTGPYSPEYDSLGPLGRLGDYGPLGGSSNAAGCLRFGGILAALAGAVLLFFSIPIFGSEVQPGGAPAGSPPAQSPAVQSPAVQSPPAASPPAQSPPATGVTGTALGVTDFTRTGGTCAETFRVGFALEANAGALTLLQLGQAEHMSSGTVSPDGDWEAMGDGQSYRGRMYGSYIGAVYMDDGGCTYDVRGWLTRMLTEPAPFSTAPGYFEFGDLQTNRFGLGILDLPMGVRPHVIVASDGDVDIRTRLPITVVLSVDGVEMSRFVIEGAPATVCRDATGCSADAPFERMARWSEPNVRLLLTATGADGQLLAAHAPNGLPAGAVAGPSPSPAPTAVPSPSAAPAPTSSPIPTTPPVATVGRGVNVPLAGLGALLLIAGLAMLAGPRLIGGPRGAPPKPPTPSGVTPEEAKKIGDILDNRPPPPPPPPTPPSPSDIAAGYEGAPSGITPAEARRLGDVLGTPSTSATAPAPTPGTPPPASGPITADEAKAIGDILGKPATPTPGTPPPASGAPPSGGAPGGTSPSPDAPKGPGQPR